MEYRKTINGIARGVLIKPPQIPDYHLMIGTAENMSDIPLLISQTKIPSKVAENLETLNKLSNEEMTQAIADGILEINDFNGNTAIIGSMIGGGSL